MDEVELIIKEAEQIPVVTIRGEQGLRVPIPAPVAKAALYVTFSLLFFGGCFPWRG